MSRSPFKAKSVQEKLAEAIFKESQCSSEPELSDITDTTEEEEEAADKGHNQGDQATRGFTFSGLMKSISN